MYTYIYIHIYIHIYIYGQSILMGNSSMEKSLGDQRPNHCGQVHSYFKLPHV